MGVPGVQYDARNFLLVEAFRSAGMPAMRPENGVRSGATGRAVGQIADVQMPNLPAHGNRSL
jgi:hypothetical protein